jgi:phage recombination protein Bet
MSTVAVRPQGTALTLQEGQQEFTPAQQATLRTLGVKDATREDLAVFFHQSVRTGLDPFARQIYMIGRWSKEGTKQTIQTGIDGYRLIARRAADRTHETLGYADTLWCGEDGQWKDVWLASTPPAAAKVTVLRNGQTFAATALWTEYAQVKKDGQPTQMWEKMSSTMLAKCAEALALRKAFPQDLSGIYTAEEMSQADNTVPAVAPVESAPRVTRQRRPIEPDPVAAGPESTPEHQPEVVVHENGDTETLASHVMATTAQITKVNILLQELGQTDRSQKLMFLTDWTGRTITSSKDLTKDEAHRFIDENTFAANVTVDGELIEEMSN